jgi:hypothetical protein
MNLNDLKSAINEIPTKFDDYDILFQTWLEADDERGEITAIDYPIIGWIIDDIDKKIIFLNNESFDLIKHKFGI